jgi:benzil reductase ((S)-benzoin forming)
MNRSSSDRIGIVTGTSTGIGEAVAKELLAREWSVIGIARRPATITHPAYRHVAFDLAGIGTSAAGLERELAPLLERSVAPTRIGLVNNAAAPEGLMPLAAVDAPLLARTYAVNVVAPIWLMGFVLRRSPAANTALRIVNVSSGAATTGFPGLAAYGSSKAALRLAGMSLASEWDRPPNSAETRRDAAILSYEPGVVDTDMQRHARSRPPDEFPWVTMFKDFAARGVLVAPERPAADIVAFLESHPQPTFAERRLRA